MNSIDKPSVILILAKKKYLNINVEHKPGLIDTV